MTWFKVDDGLHKHRKRVRAGISLDGFAAMGLWSIAGSWSSDELTDGWVPDDVLDYLAPVIGRDLAKRLEAAGLWERVTRDGEDGWQFHEWSEHQPAKEQVLADRAAAAARQKRARERAKEKRQKVDEEGHNDDASRRDSRVTNGRVTGAVTVPPTRPDPTSTTEHPSDVLFDPTQEASSTTTTRKRPRKAPASKAIRIPDDFGISHELRAWAAEEIAGFDIDREHKRFRDYWRAQGGQKATKTDWAATWRNWMRRACEERPPTPTDNPRYPGRDDSKALAQRNGIPRSTADERVADGIRLAQHFAEMDGQ